MQHIIVSLEGFTTKTFVDNFQSAHLFELPLEHVSRPLQCVLDGVGEILQCADGNGLLWRILR